MPDYAQGRIPVRPFVQILLIAHSPFLQAIEAPFDALLPPALQARHPLLVAAETDSFHVEAAVYRIALLPRDETMLESLAEHCPSARVFAGAAAVRGDRR